MLHGSFLITSQTLINHTSQTYSVSRLFWVVSDSIADIVQAYIGDIPCAPDLSVSGLTLSLIRSGPDYGSDIMAHICSDMPFCVLIHGRPTQNIRHPYRRVNLFWILYTRHRHHCGIKRGYHLSAAHFNHICLRAGLLHSDMKRPIGSAVSSHVQEIYLCA